MANFKPGGAKFKPGVSGNPGGRPKALVSVVALAREHTRASIDTLKKITTDQKASAIIGADEDDQPAASMVQ
jgi:Family of unknown function (DUF5681)